MKKKHNTKTNKKIKTEFFLIHGLHDKTLHKGEKGRNNKVKLPRNLDDRVD